MGIEIRGYFGSPCAEDDGIDPPEMGPRLLVDISMISRESIQNSRQLLENENGRQLLENQREWSSLLTNTPKNKANPKINNKFNFNQKK